MHKWMILLMSVVLSYGCATAITPELSDAGLAAKNRQKVRVLKIGMTKSDVLAVMGTGDVRVRTVYYQYGNHWDFPFEAETVHNPVRNELWNSMSGKAYEVVYYFTRIATLDGTVSDDETTPLVFENDTLAGQGWSFLNDLIKKESLQKQSAAVSAPAATEAAIAEPAATTEKDIPQK